MIDQLNHLQISTPAQPLALSPDDPSLSTLLSALLAHPDFQCGVAYGQAFFAEEYASAPLTEEEMIEEVEVNLTRHITEQSRFVERVLFGGVPTPYLTHLGFVVGTIAKGLSYAH